MEPMLLSIRQSTYRLYTEMFEKVRAENTLTQLEADILLFLSENKNQDTASEIISAKHLSKSHVSSSIENLVCNGFIERRMDGNNKKTVHLKLTDKAKPIIKAGRKVQKDFSEIIFKDISQDDIKLFNDLLCRISDNIKQAHQELSK